MSQIISPRIFLSTIFRGQPWAMHHGHWQAMLAGLPAALDPHARDMHARAADAQPAAAARSLLKTLPSHGMAVLKLSGPLLKGVDPVVAAYYGYASYDAIHEVARQVLAEGIQTLILHLDTPGGMCCGCEEAADRILSLREEGVHTIAYSDTVVCSAGYELAAVCDEVITAPSATVASIGCYCLLIDDSEFWNSRGIKFEYFVNQGSEAKLYGADGVQVSPQAREKFQTLVDRLGSRFKGSMAEHRPGIAPESMNGDYWPAQDAPAGYVDHMHYRTAAGRTCPVSTIDDLIAFLIAPVGAA